MTYGKVPNPDEIREEIDVLLYVAGNNPSFAEVIKRAVQRLTLELFAADTIQRCRN